MNSPIYRADQFDIDSYITVVGIPSMEKLHLVAVTQSAAHVTNNGVHTTISCGTPCVPYVAEEKHEVSPTLHSVLTVAEPEKTEGIPEEIETDEETTGEKRRGRPQGVHGKMVAEKLASFVFPTEPFTIRQVSELLDIEPLYLIAFFKNNCKEVGEEPKVPGKRGRASKLFLKK